MKTNSTDPSALLSDPESIYQYTSFTVLRGLLGTKDELWATSSLFLNDSKEFTRGQEVFLKVIGQFPDELAKSLMKRSIKDADRLTVYCTCFSAISDDLSQWRGYGEDGAGVCIEFDLSGINNHLNGVGYWVIYGKENDEDTQVKVASDIATYIRDEIKLVFATNGNSGSVKNEIREQLQEIWPSLFLAFKHKDFSAEKEFRVVYTSATSLPVAPEFRAFPLIPYVKLKMLNKERLPIKSITLGPAVSNPDIHRSLKLYLNELGGSFRRIETRTSGIPYVPTKRPIT